MTEHQLEAHAVMALIGVSIPVIGFLVAVLLTLRAKNKRKAITDEILSHEKRKNGKH